MKRSPLKRVAYRPKEPGRVIVCARKGCEREVYRYASDIRKGAKYCSRECWRLAGPSMESQAKRSATQRRKRQGKTNPNYRNGSRAGARDRTGERRFQSGQEVCQAVGCRRRSGLHQHHVVYEQHVIASGGDRWDPANALALCVGCHLGHHARQHVLALSALRDENYAFALALLGPAAYDYLRQRYTGDDDRLHQLLTPAAGFSGNRPDPRGASSGEG